MSSTAYNNINQQFINGVWRDGSSDRSSDNLNPYTQAHINTIQLANQADVNEAYQSAQTAQKAWAATLHTERTALVARVGEILQQRGDEIINWLVQESGSTRLKAMIELGAAQGITAEAATFPARMVGALLPSNIPHQDSRYYRQALGVIAVISPWNFPFHLSMRSVITAIACGNSVVLKPASDTPVTGGLLLAKIFEEAGLPAGVLNVVVGAGSEIGDYFVEHAIPRMVSFTGSTAVGKRVGALAVGGRYIKRVALELGGNAPLVVLDDADLDLAVNIAAMGRFLHQGQICMSTNRVIVDAKVYDAFVAKLVEKIKTVRYGNPDEMGTIVGPIINESQLSGLKKIIAQAEQDGAKLVLGGEITNQVLPPHVFIDVDPQSALAKEESFGPVLPVIKARDEAHALALANDTEYGLSSAVVTRNHERGVAFALQIEAGMTHINDITVDDQAHAPFGGEKNSGLGRFNGGWILEEFTRTHWVTVQTQARPYPL